MMKNRNLLNKMLVLGIITFFIGTIAVQAGLNTPMQEKNNQNLGRGIYTPYLEVKLADETKTFYPTDDTYIGNLNPDEKNGNLEILATRNRYDGGSNVWECDILIHFDVSSIPKSTPILSASLNLYYANWGDSNPAGRPLTVYRIKSNWNEMTVNFNSKPLIVSTVSAVADVPNNVGVWMSWNLTDDVQQHVNDPENNFGWQIMDETYWGGVNIPATYFYSKECKCVPPFCPYLEVKLANGIKTFYPTDDTYIGNLNPDEKNGNLKILATRNRYGAGFSNVWECDILIHFDVSSIPKSTPILSASLNLYYANWGDSNPAGRPLTIYRIYNNWNERTVNFSSKPWKAFIASNSQIIPNYVGMGMSWDVTKDVKLYVNLPWLNYGWEIKDNTFWGGGNVPATYFYSKEYFNP